MTNIQRLRIELNNKDYFENNTDSNIDTGEIYAAILEENSLDPFGDYSPENDRIALLKSVYSILQTVSNDIENFRRVETEFATTTAAYDYLKKRLADIKTEIEQLEIENETNDSILSYMFYNTGR